MALNFPHQPEVQLARAPVAEVICQVRFPPILNITASPPSAFQERIRTRFPMLDVEQGLVLRAAQPGAAPQPELQPPTYKFSTPDRQAFISLAADFYALSTSHYTHWADFQDDLRLVSTAVLDVYKPTHATRIGLRYLNRLTKANTQTADVSAMLQLLQPELTALMRSAAWDDPQENINQIILTDGPARLGLRTLYRLENAEPLFVLDFDYFEEGQLALEEVIQRVDRYHDTIYHAFRWSLRNGAINVFNPIT